MQDLPPSEAPASEEGDQRVERVSEVAKEAPGAEIECGRLFLFRRPSLTFVAGRLDEENKG
jgi:hypothetical protein